MEARRTAGSLIFIGSLQLFLAIMIAEFAYPGYNVSKNYISDLGVWGKTSALIFNPAIILFGALLLIASLMLWRWTQNWIFSLPFCLSALGAIGVGIFTEDSGAIHALFAFVTFFFGSLAAVASYRYSDPPLSYISVLLGAASFVALLLFGGNQYLGIGVGGMERMIAYPILLWSLGFGGQLMSISASNQASS